MKISLTDRLGNLITHTEGDGSVTLALGCAYGFEDILIFDKGEHEFVEITIDGHIVPSVIYSKEQIITYQIPVGAKTMAYHPDTFQGDSHLITMSTINNEFLTTRRNLAINGLDKRWDTGYFPHASANVVTRDEPWFEAKNAIDGSLEREGHGSYPFQSWGGGLREDLEFTLDFGREVLIDEIIIYLRADYEDDHDINWESGNIEFSNGERMTVKMSKTQEGESFNFEPQKVSWLKLKDLKREISSAYSALTQIEVYGHDC